MEVVAFLVSEELLAFGAVILFHAHMYRLFMQLSRLASGKNTCAMCAWEVSFVNLALPVDGIHVILQATVLGKGLSAENAHEVTVTFVDSFDMHAEVLLATKLLAAMRTRYPIRRINGLSMIPHKMIV